MATTPYPVAARGLLRDTLLDAAHDLLADRPWPDVTMAEVARAAGVSRQTLYKQFTSRGEFAQAYVLREAGRFLTSVEEAMAAEAAEPRRALAAAFDVFLAHADGHPVIRAVLAGGAGAEELLPLVTTQGQPLLELGTERLATTLSSLWPQLTEADARLLAACLVRLAISHAAMPEPGIDGAGIARLLSGFVAS